MYVFILFQAEKILREIAQTEPTGYTGWGIALALSLAYNYIMYRNYQSILDKMLKHLEEVTVHLDHISNILNNNHKNN